MIVTLIAAAEISWWIVLGLALSTRYLLRWRRTSTVLLLGLPAVDLVLYTLTVLNLRGGAEANWMHALAASYAGFSVGYGPSLVAWADRHFLYRFAGGPKPLPAPKYGPERTRHEWRGAARPPVSARVPPPPLPPLLPPSNNLIVAGCYSLWPKEPPAGVRVEHGRVAESGEPAEKAQDRA